MRCATGFKAFLAGLGVTAILQSSTATGLMVTGFTADGLVGLVPALAVMLGANIGTTLIVQVLSFDVSGLAPCLFLIGVVMFRKSDQARTRDFGRVAIGLGLMLLSLHQLLDFITPYEDVPSLRMFLGAISTESVLDLLLAAMLAWAAHSSVAVIRWSCRWHPRVSCRGGRIRAGARRQSRHRAEPDPGRQHRR